MRPIETGAGNIEFQMSILHTADSVAMSNLFMLTRKRTALTGGRYWRGSAILPKDFALGNQMESLK